MVVEKSEDQQPRAGRWARKLAGPSGRPTPAAAANSAKRSVAQHLVQHDAAYGAPKPQDQQPRVRDWARNPAGPNGSPRPAPAVNLVKT